jgi:branched-chain amino acid transport system permease protein
VIRRLLIFAAVVAAIWSVNGLLSGQLIDGVMISPYILQVITLAGINVILAVSLNLINGFTGQFSIGHAGFMAIGAYTSAFVSVTFGSRLEQTLGFLPDGPRRGAVLLMVLAVGAVCAAIAGFLVGVPSLRLRGDYLAIVTLGFGEIIRVFILNIDAVGGARGFSGIPKYSNFGWVYFFAIATIVVVSRIVNSSFGRTLLAVREDEIAAEAMGVNTTRAKVISFVISSAIAGVAGGLFAHYLMYVHTNSFTFLKSIEIIIMIVLGGMGSITGSVVGAVLYIALTEGLRAFEQYRMVTFSLLLILIMIFRPQGLMGHRELFGRKRREARQPAAPNIEA